MTSVAKSNNGKVTAAVRGANYHYHHRPSARLSRIMVGIISLLIRSQFTPAFV
jgi:hypothetical protein